MKEWVMQSLYNMAFFILSIGFILGGSQMHRSLKKDRDKSTTMAPVLYRTQPETASKEIMVSIMRHYSNTFQVVLHSY